MGVSFAAPRRIWADLLARTRIKICGLTREQDVRAAVDAGVDAVGFVFYPPSPRYVDARRAVALCALLPPFVTPVGLFVNADPAHVAAVLAEVPLGLLQFHGDEREDDCVAAARPYLKAARMRPGLDLVDYAARFPSARAILVDAFVDGYGGGGKVFDWSLIPQGFSRPLVLSGGLDENNVGDAIRRLRPQAVDVSSGVESEPGIKDASKIQRFVAGVRNADG